MISRTLLALLLFASIGISAQREGCVVGIAVDSFGTPLFYATVIEVGTSNGTLTDLDGRFILCADGGSSTLTVRVSYTGFKDVTRTLSVGDTTAQFVLSGIHPASGITIKALKQPLIETDRSTSNGVVTVVGYQSTFRRNITGAIQSISGSGSTSSPRKKARAKSRNPRSTTASGIPAARPRSIAPASAPKIEAGQLTAGENNDFSKWELWQDISETELEQHRGIWKIYPQMRYGVQVLGWDGGAVVDAPVRLENAEGEAVWEARTDNTGRAELWAGMFTGKPAGEGLRIAVRENEHWKNYGPATPFAEGYNTVETQLTCRDVRRVDVAMIVDATSSMGDEIKYIQAELSDVLQRAEEKLEGADLNSAAVFYRATRNQYLTKHQDFTPGAAQTVAYVNEQQAKSGGEEVIGMALQTTLDSLSWREDAIRLAFLVLDEPAGTDETSIARLHDAYRRCAARGIRLVPVVCSGMNRSGEYLMRSLALATNGTYLFVTDHSGIGKAHTDPITDGYEVEMLNDLMVRTIVGMAKTTSCGETAAEAKAPKPTETEREELRLKAFPNPTDAVTNLRSSSSNGHLFVVDVNGKILERRAMTDRRERIDLSRYASGTYVLRQMDDKRSGTVRVVRR